KSMMHLLQVIDRAGGYAFGSAEGANDTVWQVAMREGVTTMDIKDVQERWIDLKEEYDEIERKEWEEQAKIRESQAQSRNGPEVDIYTGGEDDEMESWVNPSGSSGIKVVRKSNP